MRNPNPYIPKGISEIKDQLSFMLLYSPTFADKTGYFPDRNVDSVFHQLNEGLRLIRGRLGDELFAKLREMSDRMRAHFEADAEKKTDDTLKGRELILEMEQLLKQVGRKARSP
jgi:hypothetical protein